MPVYPDGIQSMNDYLGCIVKLKEAVRRRDGEILPAGATLIVSGHHRGKLTLSYRYRTLSGHREVALRQTPRDDVEVIAWRLA